MARRQASGFACPGRGLRARRPLRPTSPDPKSGWSMLACSVLVDVDHLPLQFGSSVITAGTARPYTHALWLVAVLIVAALAARHRARKSSGKTAAPALALLPS